MQTKEEKKEYNKKWREANKIKSNLRKKKWRDDNKEYMKRYSKAYQEKNKEHSKEYHSEYYLNNKESIMDRTKEYTKNNRDKINKARRDRYKNDFIHWLSRNISNAILKSIKKSRNNKKSKSIDILGCSIIEFKQYLESKFEPWMTWENRGLYNGDFNFGWDIDHIIPSSIATTEEDIIKLNHYTNFQPLCSKVNRDIKRDIYNEGL